jgi:hypothetical protein
MPILNYTTQVDAHKTVGEIQAILAKAGVLAVSVEYTDGEPVALRFVVKVRDMPIDFRLPTRWEGVLKRMVNDPNVPNRLRNEAQARRVAWRIIKDWCEAQLALIDAGQAELAEVFLPYAVTNSGETFYQVFASSPKLLGGGKDA